MKGIPQLRKRLLAAVLAAALLAPAVALPAAARRDRAPCGCEDRRACCCQLMRRLHRGAACSKDAGAAGAGCRVERSRGEEGAPPTSLRAEGRLGLPVARRGVLAGATTGRHAAEPPPPLPSEPCLPPEPPPPRRR